MGLRPSWSCGECGHAGLFKNDAIRRAPFAAGIDIMLLRYGSTRRRERLHLVTTVMGGAQAVHNGAIRYWMVPHGGVQFVG